MTSSKDSELALSRASNSPDVHTSRGRLDCGSYSEESGIYTYASASSKNPASLPSTSAHRVHNPLYQEPLPEPHNDAGLEMTADEHCVYLAAPPEMYSDQDPGWTSVVHDINSDGDEEDENYYEDICGGSKGDLALNSATDTSTGESVETVIHQRPVPQT